MAARQFPRRAGPHPHNERGPSRAAAGRASLVGSRKWEVSGAAPAVPWAAMVTVSQIDALGERLRKGQARDGDEELLQWLLDGHSSAIEAGMAIIESMGITDITARVKTRSTLLEKLVRERSRLSRVQDIAGMRIVCGATLLEQDGLTAAVASQFPGARVVDRRAVPMHGYRAVHVVIQVSGCWIEVQLRTLLQHAWAEVFERAADIIGRRIRYGELPPGDGAKPVVDILLKWSDTIAGMEGQYALAEAARAELLAIPAVDDDELMEMASVADALERHLKEGRDLMASLYDGLRDMMAKL